MKYFLFCVLGLFLLAGEFDRVLLGKWAVRRGVNDTLKREKENITESNLTKSIFFRIHFVELIGTKNVLAEEDGFEKDLPTVDANPAASRVPSVTGLFHIIYSKGTNCGQRA